MAPSKRQKAQQEDEFGLLIKQRNSVKGSIMRIRELVFNDGSKATVEELDCRLEIVETYFAQALEIQNEIERFQCAPEQEYGIEGRSELEDLYCQTKVKIRSLMKVADRSNASKEMPNWMATHSSAENLPKLKLPTFAGKYSEFPNFIRLFKTLVDDDPRISVIEKFNHLHSCLSGAALNTIKALDLVSENYNAALQLLEARFSNKYLMCQEHIRNLVHFNKIQKGSAEQLRGLIDGVNAHFNALSSILSHEEIVHALIVHFVVAALDNESQAKIEESIDCSRSVSWNHCAKVLTQRCQILEAREPHLVSNDQGNFRHNKQVNKHSGLVALPVVPIICKVCNQQTDHNLWKCQKFIELTPMQRFEIVKRLSYCINCFSSKHTVKQCKSSKCKHCNASHHTMLHRGTMANNEVQHSNQQQLNTGQQQLQPFSSSLHYSEATSNSGSSASLLVSRQQQQQNSSEIVLIADSSSKTQTILATAVVKIADRYGVKHCARALLDSASQLNFITKDLSHKLNLEKFKSTMVIGGIGESNTSSKFSTTACISSCTSNFNETLEFLILPTITGTQPGCKINIDSWDIPTKIDLADPNFNIPQKIDLLIGADMFFQLLEGNQIQIPNDGPLFNTKFGWVVSGKCKVFPQSHHAFVAAQQIDTSNGPLESIVQKFWELEKVPETKPKMSKEHAECESHFKKHFQRLTSGRFMVKLPYKLDKSVLGDSKSMAIRRFLSLEKRLSTDLPLKEAYTDFLKQYEEDGHMERVAWPKLSTDRYYIPHHCVLRPEKSTTKCRVVFDASAKSSNNISLNDILMTGPVVQNELFDILLRFRQHKFGLMADITAMYRQIFVHPIDHNVQNIVWRKNSMDELQLYNLKTVTYGTAPAPYLATRCLMQLAEENFEKHPKVAQIIKNDFYVDDLITGGSCLEEIQVIKHQVSTILQRAQFHLRKWHSNHLQFLSTIPEEEREKTIKVNNSDVVKALGIIWDSTSDCLKFHYTGCHPQALRVTKRNVLAELSKLFDPLGLIKPVIVKAKIFMQELWLKKLSWDDPIPADCAVAWNNYVEQLMNLNTITIPRYVMQKDSLVELHGFADASTRAYGVCFYYRCTDSSGNVKVTLMTSRSKVAPIGTVRSLPCLELCAAHLMVQLLEKVRKSASFINVVLWSDSVIVLSWIAEHASSFNTFVANRVAFIQEHTNEISWRYVPSASNPADVISRGATVDELQASLWFSGPEFLKESIDTWPSVPKRLSTTNLPARKEQKTVLLVVQNELLAKIYAVSNFNKICRIIAYVNRFAKNCRSTHHRAGINSISILPEEMNEALMTIVALIQKSHYGVELSQLSNNNAVHPNSRLKSLNPFLEKFNEGLIIRVGGRLCNADLPYFTRCPIVLPKNDAFVKSYVQHLHRTNLHAGTQALVCEIRQRFWIIGARNYARKIVQDCVHCFKYRPKMVAQFMGNLPQNRVVPAKPFTNTGVDFCGPIMTTYRIRGKPIYKTYIAVFVCFTTRAVHLEVVSSLTSDAFIAALKRFIGRRGLCTTLHCDNATNFVGARNALREFKIAFLNQQFQNELTTWCTSSGIEFKHIPPRSPHFGGIWEAAVKSAKSLLYKAMQSVVLTFEELSTVIAQIEGILNSRPLFVCSSDPSDETVLTPAHFLSQSQAECILEPNVAHQPWHILKHWQQITAIQQHFWSRWSREYITTLQNRRKWATNMPNIDIGTIVLIQEDNLPPQKWLLGRIVKVIAGKDGKVRVADVQTKAGTIRRSIVKLAALPIAKKVETP